MLIDRDELARMRQEIELESPGSVGSRAAFVAGQVAGKASINRQIEKIEAQQRLREAIEQWAGIQRHKGRSDQESYKRFYYAAGTDVLSALGAQNTRDDYERMTDKVTKWIYDAIHNT